MLFFKRNPPSSLYCQTRLQQMPAIAVNAAEYAVLERPSLFHERMLELIAKAQSRIMMTLLYLQDDDAGREILQALYAAQTRNPKLHIRVYVDFHRAQRGLIGQSPQRGNSALYQSMAEGCNHPPAIYGVPVKRRELFGVMHLKGCVFDDTVLYSGASVNNVYLNYAGRYRLDRYHEIRSKELADSMCAFATEAFHINFAVQDFSQGPVKPSREIKDEIRALRRHLMHSQYKFKNMRLHHDEVGITPVAGLGKHNNQLNRTLLWAITAAKQSLFICTPYFNPPKSLLKALENALNRGIKITIVVGDKTANDFYIAPEDKFSAVGAIPYLYELNLRAFVTKYQQHISQGQLKVRLWRHDHDTYHVKGLYCDHSLAIITGNNLNPRAWMLDLENGLIVRDPHHLLREKFTHEQQYILKHTTAVLSDQDLESPAQYPEAVKKILSKVRRFRASIIIKQLL